MLEKPSRIIVQKTSTLLRGATMEETQQEKKCLEFLPRTWLRLKTLTSNLSGRMSGILWEFGPLLLTCCVLAALFLHASWLLSCLLSQLLSRRDPEIYSMKGSFALTHHHFPMIYCKCFCVLGCIFSANLRVTYSIYSHQMISQTHLKLN